MPKYYRFRALSPTRRPKRGKEKELEMVTSRNLLTVACSTTPAWAWYLRRTSWRQTPSIMGLPRQIFSSLRGSLQTNYQPMLVVKVPAY